jgi:ubiquitin C-terminal hydrolase
MAMVLQASHSGMILSTSKDYLSDDEDSNVSIALSTLAGKEDVDVEREGQSRLNDDEFPPLITPVVLSDTVDVNTNTNENANTLVDVDIDAAMDEIFELEDDDQEDAEATSTTMTAADVATAIATPASLDATFDTEMEGEADADAEIDKTSALGGLSNLGNTCYMASAMQMLASLEPFLDTLSNEEPEESGDANDKDDNEDEHDKNDNDDENDNEDNGDKSKRCLRQAFLDVMSQLAAGETVHPDEFKNAVDERSPLFIGYRQQDSHEFLITLLDLLDEDYMPKKNSEEAVAETVSMTASEAVSEIASIGEQPSTDYVIQDMEQERDDLSLEASHKKARIEEYTKDDEQKEEESLAPPISELRLLPNRQSFSELDDDEIGHLLHGTPSCRETMVFPITESHMHVEPRYKLAGGRMNTSDVALTPYESSSLSTIEEPTASEATSLMDEGLVSDCASEQSQNSSSSEPAVISPVNSHFKTCVRVRLTCDSCKFTRTHNETYLHLSLEIGPNSGSVEDGLRRFFSPETREIKCEKCFCETASQSMEIIKLPRALLLHFKRFIVDVSPDYTSITYRKNQSPVAFGDHLTLLDQDTGVLSEFLAPDCETPTMKPFQQPQGYSIRSVVNHIGSSASCGHYTADAYRMVDGDDKKREWMRFNDCFVSNISSKQALEESLQTAYMVAYELE